jgi:hypothetical protein
MHSIAGRALLHADLTKVKMRAMKAHLFGLSFHFILKGKPKMTPRGSHCQ